MYLHQVGVEGWSLLEWEGFMSRFVFILFGFGQLTLFKIP
jgi:hypothetical protein